MKLYRIILLVVALICVISPLLATATSSSNDDAASKPPLQRQPARVGAWKDIDISNVNGEGMDELMRVASKAVSQLPQRNGALKITRMLKAKRQIVNGIKYEFVLELASSANADNVETYTLIAWQQRDQVNLLDWETGDIHAIEAEISESEDSDDDSDNSDEGSDWPASDVDEDEDDVDEESNEDGDVASANPNLSQDELDELNEWLDSEDESASQP